MPLEIRPVSSRRDLARFIRLPWRIYRNHPLWVPPLVYERKRFLDRGENPFFTHGEGYHNYHHRFPADYRNGIRWYHWDPNKWFIRALRTVGLTRDLQATPPAIIEKARLQVASLHAGLRLSPAKEELGAAVRARLEAARQSLEEAQRLWQ